MNAHVKSRLTPEPLRTLRSEEKGQAEPARTRRGPSPARCTRSRAASGGADHGDRASYTHGDINKWHQGLQLPGVSLQNVVIQPGRTVAIVR